MAYVFDVNTPTSLTGPQCFYKLKTLLVSAGWTVKSSGDGLSSYNSSGDTITSGSSGANGYGNTSAWVRLQSPGGAGTRELTIQRGSSNVIWTIKYSATAGFTGGAPNATTTPTATDSQNLANAATIMPTDSTYRWNAGADNASPYGFWMGTFAAGGELTTSLGGFMMDPLLAGSYPAADNDPVVFYISTTSAWSATTTSDNLGYLKKGLGGEGFVNIPWLRYRLPGLVLTFAPSTVGSNPYNSKNDGFPIIYARPTTAVAPQGFKGVSSVARWHGPRSAIPTLLTVSTTNDRIVLGDVILPWNGSDILI